VSGAVATDKPLAGAARAAKKTRAAVAKAAEKVERKNQVVVDKAVEKVEKKKSRVVARDPNRRKLTDPVVLRALAHPVRVALLEALTREGPLTATAAAAVLDDSPGNMSWHLNVLAKYGFVEEAEGGHGRARPWRLVNLGTEFQEQDDDAELNTAAETFSRVIIDRNHERTHRWLNERRSYPPKWRTAAFSSQTITYLTAEELDAVGNELTEIMSRYRERTYDIEKRPEGSRPVAIMAFGHPVTPGPTGN
jgi:DNA-binding transcriptional ArsR family regulator